MKYGALTLIIFLLSACSGLRPDWEDALKSDTVGGQWPEQGLLNEEQAQAQGQDRSPASYYFRDETQRGNSWVSKNQAESNVRDAYRESMKYSENPNMPPAIRRKFKNGDRATRADFVDDSQNDSSLWASSGQTNYFFTKNKVKSTGDIVSVTLGDEIIRDISMELKKTLDEEEAEAELKIAAEKKKGASGKTADAGAAAGNRKPADAAAEVEGKPAKMPEVSYADIDVTPSMGVKSGDKLMAEIVERYPNGNYKIQGTKRVPYRGTNRMLTFMAIAKGTDVDDAETVESGKLYEYKLNVFR